MKFTMVRTMLGAAVLSAAVAAGAQAAAPPPPPGGFGFGGHRPPFEQALGPGTGTHGRFWNDPAIVSKLNLTDEQRKGFDQILQQHRSTLIDLHASLQKAELALEPLISSEQPDEGRILAQIDSVAAARAELEKANARFLLAIRAKLTPEQWKGLQAARAERAQQFHDRPHTGAQHRQGPPQQGGPGPEANGPGFF